jgi:hypothetical protein
MPETRAKTIAALRKQTITDNPIYPAMRERVYEGLRKAGMPDPAYVGLGQTETMPTSR